MRTYTVLISNGQRFTNWPGVAVYSESRIRVVAVAMFVYTFGEQPGFSWHRDGMMAEAYLGGNLMSISPSVQVEQVNWDYAAKSPMWTFHNGVPVPYIGPKKQIGFQPSTEKPKPVYNGALGRVVQEY